MKTGWSVSRAASLILAVLAMAGLCLPYTSAAAQSGSVAVSSPDISAFPAVSINFLPRGADGLVLTNLKSSDVRILEDGLTRLPDSFEQYEPGLQFIFAINTGPAMAYIYEKGSRFDQVKQAVMDWIGSRASGAPDDFSLVTNTGILLSRSGETQAWIDALTAYKPEVMQQKPDLNSLTSALDLAISPNDNPQMRRAILYVTTLPTDTMMLGLPNLIQQAQQSGAQVNVWLVTNPSAAESYAALALQELAAKTGGQYMLFTGREDLPLVESYLSPLRPMYRLGYTSAVNTSGTHTLSITIQNGTETLAAPEQSFQIDVQAPNPMFNNPPSTVERNWVKRSDRLPDVLLPASLDLEIRVEWPDGHPRDLVSSSLKVDGKVVQQNTGEPFDRFTWDLAEITESGVHKIQVEVVDSLGLSRSTLALPVDFIVEPEPEPFMGGIFEGGALWITLGVLAAGVVLAGVLIFNGRKRKKRLPRSAVHDPVSQPVEIRQERPLASEKKKSTPAPRPLVVANPGARLVRLNENGSPIPGSSLTLSTQELMIGSDSHRAMLVLDHPTVSPLHASIHYTLENEYLITDQGSVAGTWVNFAPISPFGARLGHGDLIQLGGVVLRFEYIHPKEIRQPKITPYEE